MSARADGETPHVWTAKDYRLLEITGFSSTAAELAERIGSTEAQVSQRRRDMDLPRTVVCKQCKGKFKVPRRRGVLPEYCSKTCKHTARKVRDARKRRVAAARAFLANARRQD